MNIFNYINLDIWQDIFNYSDFLTKIRMTQICKFMHEKLHIIDLHNIDFKYLLKLNKNNIKNFKKVEYLYASANKEINNINFMTNLKVLYANEYSGINQNAIQKLNLVELYSRDNLKITNVSFMTKLKKLDISGKNSGIDQNGINGLDLIELRAMDNKKIKSVSFMKNLKILKIFIMFMINIYNIFKIIINHYYFSILYAQERYGINQKGIDGLNLFELYTYNNSKIIDVHFMKNLKILEASRKSGIDQKGIKGLNLFELNTQNNSKIVDVSHLKNLKILKISKNSNINHEGINGLNLIKI